MRETEEVLGVLGGLGPLASSQFVVSLYEAYDQGVPEQDMVRVLMVSDPTFPDRSNAFLRGGEDESEILCRLIEYLEMLRRMGAHRLVVCCFTMHHVLPRLPAVLRDAVISLPELAVEEIIRQQRPALLLCSRGTRALGVFPAQARWEEARPHVRFLAPDDQERVHRLIHDIKGNGCLATAYENLAELARTYDVAHVIAACTELHLVARYAAQRSVAALHFIDAPSLLAMKLAGRASLAIIANPRTNDDAGVLNIRGFKEAASLPSSMPDELESG